MEDKDGVSADYDFRDTLLYKSTLEWDRMGRYCYVIKYGYKKKLFDLLVSFSSGEFGHLAGFQYMRDIELPRYNSSNLMRKILNGVVTQAMIEKSAEYKQSVEPRLLALLSLEKLLNGDFTLFSFKPEFYSSFRTGIKANYLISSKINGTSYVFLFTEDSRDAEARCICRSIFVKGKNDFEENQRPLAVLKKSRTDITTSEEEVLFTKNGFEG